MYISVCVCACVSVCVCVLGHDMKCAAHYKLRTKIFEVGKYSERDLTETILYFLVASISQTTLANCLPLLD